MNNLTDIHLKFTFDQIDDMDLIYGEKYELTIYYNNVPYDFILDLKRNSANMLVLLTSGLPFGTINTADKPIYRRWKWNFSESSICCNDPTFYLSENVNAGFHLGKKDDWYLKNMALILKKIFDKLHLANEQIIFYGSSMGGTAAIMLSVLLPNTISIADIPILDATANSHWRDVKKYCFDDAGMDTIENYSYRFNVIDLINHENYVPNTYLLLDFSVEDDCIEQYFPFLSSLDKIKFDKKDLSMKIRIDRKHSGHLPLDEIDFNILLKKVLSNNMGIPYENTIVNPTFLSSLLIFLRARVDLKNFGDENNSVEILSISDMHSKVIRPEWFKNEEGSGLNITSITGYLNIKVRCIQEGDFYVFLRSMDFRDADRKRLTIYIIYEYLKVNDQNIFETDTTVSHDKPYIFKKSVHDGEIVDIKIKWRPFDAFGNIIE